MISYKADDISISLQPSVAKQTALHLGIIITHIPAISHQDTHTSQFTDAKQIQ